MVCMLVTPEVSKLSGWLNADASCRESKGGHAVRGEVRAGRAAGGRRPRRKQRAGERARMQIGGRAGGGAHPEHPGHGRDAGGVEAQRLVERRPRLPRVERRAYAAERGAVRGGGRRRAIAGHTACRGGLGCRFGAGHGEGRTWNM